MNLAKKKKEGMGAENTHYQSYLKKEFYQTVYISSGKVHNQLANKMQTS